VISLPKKNHQFSVSAVELEFLRSERRLRSGRHFVLSAVISRSRHSFYALLLLKLFLFQEEQPVPWREMPLPRPQRAVAVAVAVVRAEVTVQQ
jgi:hypothetical protein